MNDGEMIVKNVRGKIMVSLIAIATGAMIYYIKIGKTTLCKIHTTFIKPDVYKWKKVIQNRTHTNRFSSKSYHFLYGNYSYNL